MGRKTLYLIGGFIVLYLVTCIFLYLYQEPLLFHSRKLPSDHKFAFNFEYEEVTIETTDNTKLNGVLCKADTSLGLIFFLHGSGGNVERYKENIPFYTSLGYDMFLLDYRGYGKSEGKIHSEEQFYDDVKLAYKEMSTLYKEENIVILGFSLGGVPAAMLASTYRPKHLILEGTVYSILEKAKKKLPFLPMSIISRYDFEIIDYINDVSVPIAIFHGDNDKDSDISNALRLKPLLKTHDLLIILEGEGHSDFAKNKQFRVELKKLLQED